MFLVWMLSKKKYCRNFIEIFPRIIVIESEANLTVTEAKRGHRRFLWVRDWYALVRGKTLHVFVYEQIYARQYWF